MALGHKSMEKKRGSVIYSTDRKNEANKMFSIDLWAARFALGP